MSVNKCIDHLPETVHNLKEEPPEKDHDCTMEPIEPDPKSMGGLQVPVYTCVDVSQVPVHNVKEKPPGNNCTNYFLVLVLTLARTVGSVI